MTVNIKIAIVKDKQGKTLSYKLTVADLLGDAIALKAKDANRIIKQLTLKIASVVPDVHGNLLYTYQ